MSGAIAGLLGPLAQIFGLAQGAAGGAFPALVAQLENAGLSERVHSWMGHGENHPVTPDELKGAFTPAQLDHWAEQTGVTHAELLQHLSETLPGAVDQAAPKPPKD